MNRDPIEEEGGLNVYGFVGNDGILRSDFLGLTTFNSITVKRLHVKWLALIKEELFGKSTGLDTYGHWWIEFDGESYGWWPSGPVSSLAQTVLGVPGRLNGLDVHHQAGLATQTRDRHHGDNADEWFNPRLRYGFLWLGKLKYGSAEGQMCICATEDEIKSCLREFAADYSGNWSYPLGQNCHSFQEKAMKSCCLKK